MTETLLYQPPRASARTTLGRGINGAAPTRQQQRARVARDVHRSRSTVRVAAGQPSIAQRFAASTEIAQTSFAREALG